MGPVFHIGDEVRLIVSGERGTVIGIAEYAESNPDALVRYCAGDGRAVEAWWKFSALETV
jgi:hypothetical protein